MFNPVVFAIVYIVVAVANIIRVVIDPRSQKKSTDWIAVGAVFLALILPLSGVAPGNLVQWRLVMALILSTMTPFGLAAYYVEAKKLGNEVLARKIASWILFSAPTVMTLCLLGMATVANLQVKFHLEAVAAQGLAGIAFFICEKAGFRILRSLGPALTA